MAIGDMWSRDATLYFRLHVVVVAILMVLQRLDVAYDLQFQDGTAMS